MNAALVSIAEAVVADLIAGQSLDVDGMNAGVSHNPPRISQTLNVQLVYVPRFHPPDQAASAWQVLVSPAGEETERLDRNELKATYHVEIGICAKLPSLDNSTLEAALQLLQELGDYFFDFGLTDESATWVRNQVYAWPDRERLGGDGVVLAVWDAVFEGSRKKAK